MATVYTPRHRAHTSVDHVLHLVDNLDENQIQILLDDINSSAETNVEVKKGINHFQNLPLQVLAPSSRKPLRQLSFQKRPHRKGDASTRFPIAVALRPRGSQQQQQQQQSGRRIVSAPVTSGVKEDVRPRTAEALVPVVSSTKDDDNDADDGDDDDDDEVEEVPVLEHSPPQLQQQQKKSTYSKRHYKRISRPTLPSADEIADLNALVAAFLEHGKAPLSSSQPKTMASKLGFQSPPATPSRAGFMPTLGTLLEPEAMSEPVVLGLRQKKSMGNIGSIFGATG